MESLPYSVTKAPSSVSRQRFSLDGQLEIESLCQLPDADSSSVISHRAWKAGDTEERVVSKKII